MTDEVNNVEVIAVMPDKIKIAVRNLEESPINNFKIGSYLKVKDHEDHELIVMIEDYSIETSETSDKKYIITANQLGVLKNNKFIRGGDNLVLPPREVQVVTESEIQKIYETNITDENKFCFSKLVQNENINVNVNGNKFFNKHFAIVGSTGSGKSHTTTSILQKAISSKKSGFDGLNNSHIILFDIHGEYSPAFPNANKLNIDNLVLPYWLLNSEELEDLFLDTEANDHNQRNIFKEQVIENKKNNFDGSDADKERIHYDSPLVFQIKEVLRFAQEKDVEMVNGSRGEKQGSLFGKLTNFISRLENKINDTRFDFLLGDRVLSTSLESILKQFLGYIDNEQSNITIIDLSGVPFEVLNISVSLISRLLFEYSYTYKKMLNGEDLETPLLLVYEEAHKYVPKSELVKFRASKSSIERIAKEGRKYGITMGIVSQRPSEISETIFSQCNNFLAMRLTNPDDQYSVRKLLPDSLGNMTMSLPSLQSGEAILTGDSIIIPSIVKIEKCNPEPHSSDVNYLEIWKNQWEHVDFANIKTNWKK